MNLFGGSKKASQEKWYLNWRVSWVIGRGREALKSFPSKGNSVCQDCTEGEYSVTWRKRRKENQVLWLSRCVSNRGALLRSSFERTSSEKHSWLAAPGQHTLDQSVHTEGRFCHVAFSQGLSTVWVLELGQSFLLDTSNRQSLLRNFPLAWPTFSQSCPVVWSSSYLSSFFPLILWLISVPYPYHSHTLFI